MDCEQIRELLEAYALGALEAEEQARVERHLAACADCQRLAKEYAEAAHTLPQALATAAPMPLSASLKARLLQSLEASAPPPVRPAPAASRPGGRAPDLSPWRWPAWARGGTFRVVVVVILLVLAFGWNAQLQVELARARALRAEYADLVGQQQELVLEVVDSSKTVRAVLRPTMAGSPSYGKLFTRPDMADVVVMAARLPQPPQGQAYHVWLTSQGQTRLAGVLAVNSKGFGLLLFKADRNGPVYGSALLTLQPDGGTAPSGVPVLVWEAPQP